jgi:hypothetical protein
MKIQQADKQFLLLLFVKNEGGEQGAPPAKALAEGFFLQKWIKSYQYHDFLSLFRVILYIY